MITISIPGMSCGHCKAAVEKALTSANATSVFVDLDNKTATVEGSIDLAAAMSELRAAGFEASVVG